MTGVLVAHFQQLPAELMQMFCYCLTAFAAVVSVLATLYAIGNIDATGITSEGRVTSIIPIVLAACGLALTVRWSPEHTLFAVVWLVMHIPGVYVGVNTPTSTLQQSLRREQSLEDQRIAIEWELKQLSNRVTLLEQLVRPGGPDPFAQKKLATTGNTLEKYYADTKEQLEKFLQQTRDESQRAAAESMLKQLTQMQIAQIT